MFCEELYLPAHLHPLRATVHRLDDKTNTRAHQKAHNPGRGSTGHEHLVSDGGTACVVEVCVLAKEKEERSQHIGHSDLVDCLLTFFLLLFDL